MAMPSPSPVSKAQPVKTKAKTAEPGPKKRRRRIEWTPAERAMLIEAGADIIRKDTAGKLSHRSALIRAQHAIKADRRRDLHGVKDANLQWFKDGVKKLLGGIPANSTAASAQPAAPSPVPPIVGSIRRILAVIVDEINKYYPMELV